MPRWQRWAMTGPDPEIIIDWSDIDPVHWLWEVLRNDSLSESVKSVAAALVTLEMEDRQYEQEGSWQSNG